MDSALCNAIANAFIEMTPYALLIAILTRLIRMLVRSFSGGEEFI